MSAVIEVTQNPSGSWTARGQYNGVFAEVTSADRQKAATAISNTFAAFAPTAHNVDESCGQDAEAAKCKTCKGSGKEYDGAAHTCTACNGSGQETKPCN